MQLIKLPTSEEEVQESTDGCLEVHGFPQCTQCD